MMAKIKILRSFQLGLLGVAGVCAAATVPESARELPRLADVDVVVVGGTVAGVQAAAAAKAAGASVFLVAPRFQLGEEIVTTRNLWLDDADEGVADAFVANLFSSDRAYPYTYTYNKTPASSHTDPGQTRLIDGAKTSAATESVQFDDDVTVTANLGPNAGQFLSLRLMAFHRGGSGGFVTGNVTVKGSDDGVNWTSVNGTVASANETIPGQADTLDTLTFTPAQTSSPAYLQITCVRASGFSRQLLGELAIVTTKATPSPTKPLVVAQALDKVLLDAEVPFLTGSPVTDVLRDGAGRVSGVAVANRNGRQAITAKVVIDATEWSAAARAAGVAFTSGTSTTRFSRTVICRKGDLEDILPPGDGWTVAAMACPQASISVSPDDLKGVGAPGSFTAGAYVVSRDFPFANLTYAGWLAIERQMRAAIWTNSVAEVSEKCAFTPPDHVTGQSSASGTWPGAAELSLDVFRPAGVAGLLVLGPCADIARADAAKLQMVGVETILGRRVGAAAASEAASAVRTGTVGLGAAPTAGSAQVHERLTRPLNVGTEDGATVTSAGADLPVLAETDVLVVGGGTAGVPAALAAAGQNRSVVVADILYVLGGTPVDNRIGRYYHGNQRGFATNLLAQVKAHGWVFYAACPDWQLRSCVQAGADVWLGAFAEGVVTDGGDGAGRARVTGVVFVLPDGTRGVVRATATVDATGNADLTAAAGGATTFLNGPEFAAQGVGASNIQLGNSYLNTDVGFLDDTDAGDLSHFMLRSRLALTVSWMQPSFPSTGSRERRRIVGDVTVTELDVVRGRTWPDTIMHGSSNFDMHGFSTSPLLMFWVHPSDDLAADLPFRALLPQGLEGVLATGLGISATRDAMPILRMQPDVQNQGWAAGLAAAAACGNGGTLRTIDVKDLQRALVAADMLDVRVVEDADGGTVTTSELDTAIAGLSNNFHGLESILAADPEVALPKLRTAYENLSDSAWQRQLVLGTVLALMGDATAVDLLLRHYEDYPWDTGYNFKGMGCYGRQTSEMDYMLYALAQTRDPRIVPLMGALAGTLADANGNIRTLSHFRMLNLAAQAYPVSVVAVPMTNAVAKGQAKLLCNAVFDAQPASYDQTTADTERTRAVTDLALAETLLRLGDPDGAGRRTLEAYAVDPRASYASWARRLLALEVPDPVTDMDAVWTSTAATGDWSGTANWRNGQVAEGPTSTATFEGLAGGASQTVRIPQEGAAVGSFVFTDAANRIFTGGPLSLLSPLAALDVAGGSVVFGNDMDLLTVEKTGAGSVTFAGAAQVAKRITLSEGVVRLENGATTRAVTDASFTVSSDEDLYVTHLGYRAEEVEALVGTRERIRVTLVDAGNVKQEAVLFTTRHQGFVQDGVRYLRLGTPRLLAAGASCTLQMSTSQGPIGGYSAALLAAKTPEQYLKRARVDTRLEIDSPLVTVAYPSGTGVVASVSSSPVNLTIAGSEPTFDGRIVQEGGPIALTKEGIDTATIRGAQGLRDGVTPMRGTLVLDSPAALAPEATIVFGSRYQSANPNGNLAFETADAVVSNPVSCVKMWGHNCYNIGFTAFAGKSLTLRDTIVTTPDSACSGGNEGTLCLMPNYSADSTRVVVENVEFPYIDLAAQISGERGKERGGNSVLMRNVTAPEGLRKMSAINMSSNSVGGTLTIAESSLRIDWLDFCGPYVGFNLTTGSTIVATNVRFPNTNGSLHHSNADILVDGGARVVANGFPTAGQVFNTTNTLLRFDDAVIQLKSENVGDFFPISATNPPIEILEGGLTFDLAAHDLADGYPYRSLRIRHPMTSPVAGVPGPLTILGADPTNLANGGECKFSAPMSFNGPTTVRGGTLVFDFETAPALETMLAPGTDLVLDGGMLQLVSKTANHHESFATITNAAVTAAPIQIAEGCTVATSALVGEGGFEVKGGTLALDLELTDSERINGHVVLDGATLALTTQMRVVAPTLVPGGSFEPVTPFPEPEGNNVGSLDRRGQNGASWLKTNVPDWTFANDNNVGVTRNGSYFTRSVTNGVTCAFLRSNSGTVGQTFTVERAARYTLVFDWRSRDYNNMQCWANVQVWCDGQVVYATQSTLQNEWAEATVDLGVLAPGTHTIAFGNNVVNGDALLDNVRLGYSAEPTQADLERIVSPDLELDLRNNARIELGFAGRLPVHEVRIDGEKRYGIFSAETMPSRFSGTGSFFCNPTGTLILFR